MISVSAFNHSRVCVHDGGGAGAGVSWGGVLVGVEIVIKRNPWKVLVFCQIHNQSSSSFSVTMRMRIIIKHLLFFQMPKMDTKC